MTIEQCKNSKKPFLELADIIPDIVPVSIPTVRQQVFSDRSRLGFPVVTIGTRILVPRVPFLNYVLSSNEMHNAKKE